LFHHQGRTNTQGNPDFSGLLPLVWGKGFEGEGVNGSPHFFSKGRVDQAMLLDQRQADKLLRNDGDYEMSTTTLRPRMACVERAFILNFNKRSLKLNAKCFFNVFG